MDIITIKVIKTCTTGLLSISIRDLYTFLKGSAHREHLEQILSRLDITAELDVIQALLDDLSNLNECNTVKIASKHVKETVDAIHEELKKINDILEYHKIRYFNKWRNIGYEPYLECLCTYRKTLRKRRKLLFSVLNLSHLKRPYSNKLYKKSIKKLHFNK